MSTDEGERDPRLDERSDVEPSPKTPDDQEAEIRRRLFRVVSGDPA